MSTARSTSTAPASGGRAVGHGREELARVAAEQMSTLEFYASFWNFANEPSIRLAARLAELSPPGLERLMFFTNGGSERSDRAEARPALQHAWLES